MSVALDASFVVWSFYSDVSVYRARVMVSRDPKPSIGNGGRTSPFQLLRSRRPVPAITETSPSTRQAAPSAFLHFSMS